MKKTKEKRPARKPAKTTARAVKKTKKKARQKTFSKGFDQRVFLSMRIKADLRNLVVLRDAADENGPANGLNAKQTSRLRLCIDEAFTNIVKHAYKNSGKNNYVEIDMSVGPKLFEVSMRDKGYPFKLDAGAITWPDLEKYIEIEKKGGLGLFVLKKFTDYLQIHHEKGVNRLVMGYRLKK